MIDPALLSALLLLLPIAATARDLESVGSFHDVTSQDGGEYCAGYSLGLWKYGDHLMGLLDVHQGLCGDPPCGTIRDAILEPKTGKLRFRSSANGRELRFEGRMSREAIEGEFNGQRVRLALDPSATPSGFEPNRSIAAWCGFWSSVPRCNGVQELCRSLGVVGGKPWRMSMSGLGQARIGMTTREAARALGVDLVTDGAIDSPRCYYVKARPAIEGLAIMVSHGHVVRFDVDAPGLRTRSGIGVGDTESRVKEVCGAALEIVPHKYLAAEGNYLTIWSSNRRSAVRFETHLGKVTSFYAGRVPEVRHVEGCS
jgi:hypothetical protein